jgi:hypothetical protein
MHEKQLGVDDGTALVLREPRAVLVEDLRTSKRWHRDARAIADGCSRPVLALAGTQGILLSTAAPQILAPTRDLDRTS